MAIKVGINGFGRIGRLALRASWDWPEFELVQINDPAGDAETHAHLINFDSIHGRWHREAGAEGDSVVIDGKRIKVTANKTIADTDWSGCDLVLEASGKMKSVAVLQAYLDLGVKRVVVCAPVKEKGALNVVMGVNQHLFDPGQHRIVTAASCTTNCLAPVVKVIHENLGIRHGSITTESPSAPASWCQRPWTESKLIRWAWVSASPAGSLIWTNSNSGQSQDARSARRPIRPNPLMPTLIAMFLFSSWDFRWIVD